MQTLSAGGEKGDDLIRVLRELTSVQRKIADLQVELQGRKVRLSIFDSSLWLHVHYLELYLQALLWEKKA